MAGVNAARPDREPAGTPVDRDDGTETERRPHRVVENGVITAEGSHAEEERDADEVNASMPPGGTYA